MKNKLPCVITIIGGLLNIIGMYLLLKFTNLGVYSVVITTAIIMIIINIFFNPKYAAWCLKTSSKPLYKTIFRHIIAVLVLLVVFRLVALVIVPISWISLIFSAILMAVFGLFIYIVIVCEREEISILLKSIKRGNGKHDNNKNPI